MAVVRSVAVKNSMLIRIRDNGTARVLSVIVAAICTRSLMLWSITTDR